MPAPPPGPRERIEAALAQGDASAVIVIDLDRFGLINEGLGRAVGNELLADVGALLRTRAVPGMLTFRLEGDRFVIGVPPDSPPQELGARVLEILRQATFHTGSSTIRLTASAGVATAGVGRDPEDVVHAAESAVRDAKDLGRDRLQACSALDQSRRLKAIGLADAVRRGIDGNALQPVFQPILDLRSSRVTHLELLARMRAQDGTVIPPAEFIPVAEHLGLIGLIDQWAIEAAVATLGKLPEQSVTVNVSGRSIGDADIQDSLCRPLEEAFDPTRIVVELTETASVASLDAAREFGVRIRELGADFALDDFGSGFGSLAYLKQLPLSMVKIDGEFVRGVARSASNQVFLRTLVTLARDLGIESVVEFVSDSETLDCVRGIGADYAQGYAIGRPGSLPQSVVRPSSLDLVPEAV